MSSLPELLPGWDTRPQTDMLDGAPRLILRVSLAVFTTEPEMQVYQVGGGGRGGSSDPQDSLSIWVKAPYETELDCPVIGRNKKPLLASKYVKN